MTQCCIPQLYKSKGDSNEFSKLRGIIVCSVWWISAIGEEQCVSLREVEVVQIRFFQYIAKGKYTF